MKNSNFTFIKLLVLCMVLISGTYTMVSQNNFKSNYRLGLGVGTHLSGNAHGAIYDGSISLYNGTNHFSVAACIQKRKETLCGAGFRYAYILTGRENFSPNGTDYETDDRKIQLFTFVYAQYLKGAKLSKNAVYQEECNTKSQKELGHTDYSTIQLSTADIYAGFGVNTKISKQLIWSSSIGFGTYYHLDYIHGMYTERISPVLMLSTALRLNHFRR